MATIVKRGEKYFAQIRRTGYKSVSRSFETKALGQEWVRKVEREMDEAKYQDIRPIASITLETLIDRYVTEIGGTEGFGRNKQNVYRSLKKSIGYLKLSEITAERLSLFAADRIASGAGGVTVSIDLTYLKLLFKVASELWNIHIDMKAVTSAKASLKYKGISTQGNERTRRPTQSEVTRIIAYFNARSTQITPMWDIVPFAIATAMRLGEIVRIRWEDINVEDRTVVIRDRKHPREKVGNDHTVPLLGEAFEIAMRQTKNASDTRIFPFNGDTISSTFPRAMQALGIHDLRFHDLRHEGVSRLFEQGYTIEQVSLVSGHRDWSMLRRYVQLKAKDLHRD